VELVIFTLQIQTGSKAPHHTPQSTCPTASTASGKVSEPTRTAAWARQSSHTGFLFVLKVPTSKNVCRPEALRDSEPFCTNIWQCVAQSNVHGTMFLGHVCYRMVWLCFAIFYLTNDQEAEIIKDLTYEGFMQ